MLQARRPVSAGSARSLLLTVLGELVHPLGRPVWTSALLHVLTGLGVEEQTARQAIARGAAAGWIAGEKQGREVRWELTGSGRRLIEEGTERVDSVDRDRRSWDGTWLIVLITVPQSHRSVRKKLYGALSWAGFGNPTPGVWLSPYPERETEARRVVEELDLADQTLSFAGPSRSVGLSDREIVARAWDLDEVVAKYEALLERFSAAAPEPGDPVLLTHLDLVNEWQRFPFIDPQLPAELLPDWIGREAATLLRKRRREWYDDAQARWREVVDQTSPA